MDDGLTWEDRRFAFVLAGFLQAFATSWFLGGVALLLAWLGAVMVGVWLFFAGWLFAMTWLVRLFCVMTPWTRQFGWSIFRWRVYAAKQVHVLRAAAALMPHPRLVQPPWRRFAG